MKKGKHLTASRVSLKLLSCFSSFLSALQQNRAQSRFFYLLNCISSTVICALANFYHKFSLLLKEMATASGELYNFR